MIINPILPGFHPDPSIIRVAADYYIATSTFEWFPGVRIYHSTDLANWQLVATPLNRLSQLDMRGNPDSCGVWAPCLSYDEGTFYLVYTNARRYWSHCKDTPNYVVTTRDIRGDWSEPVFLTSSGFDPSLFHAPDGRKWLLNMVWDHRQRGNPHEWHPDRYFGGITLQEYNVAQQKLVDEAQIIYRGSALGKAEGPHLYWRDGYYYLLTAEGGTGLEHACVVSRAKNIQGPYETDPHGLLLTSNSEPAPYLQRAGHGDFVTTDNDETLLAHLCSRPLDNGRSVMGRETAIQKIDWPAGGWPRLVSGNNRPETNVNYSGSEAGVCAQPNHQCDNFDADTLDPVFQSLRIPLGEETLSLNERPGYLRLAGRDSLGSSFTQALIARRQQAFCFEASTQIDFQPTTFQQMAGLVCYYNSCKYFYLHVTTHETLGKILEVACCSGDVACQLILDQPIAVDSNGEIGLKAVVANNELRFSYSTVAQNWREIPQVFDYSLLSDEVGEGGEHANFTGAFIGLCCQDLSGQARPAYFDYFEYRELPTKT